VAFDKLSINLDELSALKHRIDGYYPAGKQSKSCRRQSADGPLGEHPKSFLQTFIMSEACAEDSQSLGRPIEVCQQMDADFMRKQRVDPGTLHGRAARDHQLAPRHEEARHVVSNLDGGIEEATRFVLRESANEIARVRSPEFLRDFKSALQELLQAQDQPLPEYVLAASTGPDHDKRFHVEVRLGADVLAEGAGRTKKDAEQEAARAALDRLRPTSSPNRGDV